MGQIKNIKLHIVTDIKERMDEPTLVSLLSLPSEVRLHVFSFCIKDDLRSLSLCSKKLYKEVLASLWKRVEISWPTLQKITSKLSKGPMENMRLISHLEFSSARAEKLEKGYFGFGFSMFLRDCDPERMKSMTFNDYVVKNGIHFVSEIFPHLEHLEFYDVTADWNFLSL